MRKRGARIKHHIACLPFNNRVSIQYETEARAALLALQANVHTEDNLIRLVVLAELCNALGSKEQYIRTHADAVKRMVGLAMGSYCSRWEYVSLASSVDLLIDWLHQQPNAAVSRVALTEIDKIGRMK